MEQRKSLVWDSSRLDGRTVCLAFLLAFVALFVACIVVSYANNTVTTQRYYGFTIAGCVVGAAFWLARYYLSLRQEEQHEQRPLEQSGHH